MEIGDNMRTYRFKINGDKYKARILEYKDDKIKVKVNDVEYKVELEDEVSDVLPKLVRAEKFTPDIFLSSPIKKSYPNKQGNVIAPLPGLITRILVKEKERVNIGDPVMILEAMKMESEITSDFGGIVRKINVKEDDIVQEGDTLLELGK